jgi:hypothetical protein
MLHFIATPRHHHGSLRCLLLTITLAVPCLSARPASVSGQDYDLPPVSQYAPIDDVESQIDVYAARLAEDLADRESYLPEVQDRVAKDAATIAVLSLVLGRHDQQSRRKPAAAKLLELATQISEEAGDYETAKEALGELQQALAEPKEADEVEWSSTADMVLLMEQVPIVNNSLRRGVTSRRFERSLEATAGHAVALAAIAQASLVDDTYAGDEEDLREWQRLCAELRDSAADVYRAVRAKDQARAKDGLARIVKTCDDCHDVFK